MFSDRIQDGIERGPEQYFKRANRKSPEKGGALEAQLRSEQDRGRADLSRRSARAGGRCRTWRSRRTGSPARVDHRSLAEQGIQSREPGVHQGPAVAGIEARGEVSRVGERQREQIAAREAKREAVLHEARKLERAHEVAERVAARERRELAPLAAEAPAEDRAELERAGRGRPARATRAHDRSGGAAGGAAGGGARGGRAPAARRSSRGWWSRGEALQKRLAQAFERVKEWVHERFRPVLTREEIQAGKAEFRAEYERHRAEEAERARALEAGRERYAREKAAELARQRELEQGAKEPDKLKGHERGKDLGAGAEEEPKLKDRDHGLEL